MLPHIPSSDSSRGVSPPALFVELTDPAPGTVLLTAFGEVDLFTAPLLREGLLEALARRPLVLVVDLDRLTFFDASTLGLMAQTRTHLAADGGELRVRCESRTGRRLFAITGLSALLEEPRGFLTPLDGGGG